jgi:hypothetical protein
MGKIKPEKTLKPKKASDKNVLDDLDKFIEKRKLQNEALKKLISENGKTRKKQ